MVYGDDMFKCSAFRVVCWGTSCRCFHRRPMLPCLSFFVSITDNNKHQSRQMVCSFHHPSSILVRACLFLELADGPIMRKILPSSTRQHLRHTRTGFASLSVNPPSLVTQLDSLPECKSRLKCIVRFPILGATSSWRKPSWLRLLFLSRCIG